MDGFGLSQMGADYAGQEKAIEGAVRLNRWEKAEEAVWHIVEDLERAGIRTRIGR